MKEFWDNRFAGAEYTYGTEPNEFLAECLHGRRPGRILLPAEGEGRNAVFAAQLGWQVEAFDFSAVARDKALHLAAERRVSISYQLADVMDFEAADSSYDLIALLYLHLDPTARKAFHGRVARMLTANGTIILEAFSKEQLANSSGGPKDPDMLYSLDELRGDFAGLDLECLQREEIVLQEGKGHSGTASVIRMVAKKIG